MRGVTSTHAAEARSPYCVLILPRLFPLLSSLGCNRQVFTKHLLSLVIFYHSFVLEVAVPARFVNLASCVSGIENPLC